MEIDELLGQVRKHYLDHYRESARRYLAEYQPGGPEVLMELQGERPYEYRLYRVDLASGSVEPPNLTEVNPQGHLSFSPIEAASGDMRLALEPFVWNGVEFDCSPQIRSDELLRIWTMRWLDPEESADSDDDGLGNYIHSVTQPQNPDEQTTSFSVDFGSAQIDSWFELIEVLKNCGVGQLTIHSRQTLGEGNA